VEGAPPAVAVKSAVKHRPAPAGTYAEGVERMNLIKLEPSFSTKELPGKCIKCLAEQELGSCLRELLNGEIDNKELEEKYEALVSFLQSPESAKLRDKCEKYLAEGKEVRLKLYFWQGKPKYEIKLT
jgi:hypothetical protein